mmetsp:Transcript_14838/g.21227  ORF Transcript_14838/g.21227 Transcript_14838/m.21227 type:complete len:449 (+) Transcript_14838:48-1394(+)
MASIKRDEVKQKWEETEFPLVCETCLGDNPYVRMTKQPHGKACKICEVPFTVFAWQAGTKGRLKRVEICRTCAQTKNVCQVCIFDLKYGLPVQVRDRVLREEAANGGGSSGSHVSALAVPQSDANRSWYNAQNERMLAQNGTSSVVDAIHSNPRAAARLASMARMEPRYERNLAKLCTFFARGECDRGSSCPFRHEMPRDRNDPLSKQNTKDRFYGQNDPVADRMIGRQKENAEKRRKEARERGDQRAVSTCYVRFDPSKNNSQSASIPTESQLRDSFYGYGEITGIRMHANQGAFVEYSTSNAASLAISGMNHKSVHGMPVRVTWARTPKRGNTSSMISSSSTVGPVAPPNAGKNNLSSIPPGFVPVRPSAQVAAAAAKMALRNSTPGSNTNRLSAAVPRPGGGPIRRVGTGLASRGVAPQPYYPSSDPGRLGSRTSANVSSTPDDN